MSMFLPEQSSQPQDGVVSVTPANPETTQADVALMQRVLAAAARNPNLIPSDFMAYLFDYIQTGRLQIPIGQVFGFQKFVATQVSIYQSTGTDHYSTTLTAGESDQTSAGPSIELGDAGQYVLLAACNINADPAVVSGTSWAIASGPTVTGEALGSYARFAAHTAASDAEVLTSLFHSGSNSASTSRTVSLSNALVIAIRYAN